MLIVADGAKEGLVETVVDAVVTQVQRFERRTEYEQKRLQGDDGRVSATRYHRQLRNEQEKQLIHVAPVRKQHAQHTRASFTTFESRKFFANDRD